MHNERYFLEELKGKVIIAISSYVECVRICFEGHEMYYFEQTNDNYVTDKLLQWLYISLGCKLSIVFDWIGSVLRNGHARI